MQQETRDISDEAVEEFIASHPNGASPEVIGEVMGLTRERVYQLLRKALAKCQRVCRERDIAPSDFPERTTTWDRLQRF